VSKERRAAVADKMASAGEMALLCETVHQAVPNIRAERAQAHTGRDKELLRFAIGMVLKCDLSKVDPRVLLDTLRPGYDKSKTPAEFSRWVLEQERRRLRACNRG
jgi:hypothetical protein